MAENSSLLSNSSLLFSNSSDEIKKYLSWTGQYEGDGPGQYEDDSSGQDNDKL